MNIVGENFPEKIVKQINVRQKKKGAKIRDNQNLVWQNANTGWIKMASSVDVNLNQRKIASNDEMMETTIGGSSLAKQYVLFGGAYYQGKNKDGLSKGIARNGSVLNHAAYGLGGLDLGLRPMPGITSFSIKSENRGSLRTSTIGIKCYNRHQFDIINTLYLSLGYSVLIEWGNTMYYDNNEKFEEENTYSLADEFLKGTLQWDSILDNIQEKRLASCGNYDALLGRIVNFRWTLNKDLSYDITVTIISMGDIIESLKMNALSGYIPVDLSLARQFSSVSYNNGPVNTTAQQNANYERVLKIATALGSSDPVLTASIAMNESGWLSSAYFRNGNNAFGQTIKPSQIGTNGIVGRIDVNVSAKYIFAKYDSLESSVRHHLKKWQQYYIPGNVEASTKNLVLNRYNRADPQWAPVINRIYNDRKNRALSNAASTTNAAKADKAAKTTSTTTPTNNLPTGNTINTGTGTVNVPVLTNPTLPKSTEELTKTFKSAISFANKAGYKPEYIAQLINNPNKNIIAQQLFDGLKRSGVDVDGIVNTFINQTNSTPAIAKTPVNSAIAKLLATAISGPTPSTTAATNTPNPYAQSNLAIKDNVSNKIVVPIQNTTQTPTQGAPGTNPETAASGAAAENAAQVDSTNPVDIISKYAYSHDIGALFYNTLVKLNDSFTITDGSSIEAVKLLFVNGNSGETTPQYYIRLGYFLKEIEKNIIYRLKNSDKSKIIKIDYDTDSNIILLYNRQLSANPNACIFQKSFKLSDGTDITLFPDTNKFMLEGKYSSRYGKIMNSYFSMSYILQQMEASKDADTNTLSLIDLLKILTKTFCDSTGNFNKIEPTVDADTNTIKFIDSLPLPEADAILKNKSESTARFDMYGYYAYPGGTEAGIVRDLSLTTTVSPKLATMLTIGAQSNGYVTGQDSTALSVMNYGLKDRVKEEWIEPSSKINYPSPAISGAAQPNSPNDPPTLNEKYQFIITTFNRFIQEMAENQWNQEDVTAFSNSIQSLAEYSQAEETLKHRKDNPYSSSPGIGFLPFDLTLTIDGLSGMKIYQKFVADTEFLPSNYPQSLEFLIKGITHEIKDNQWVTTLESLAVPKSPFGSKNEGDVGAKITGRRSGNSRPEGFTPNTGGKGSARSVTSGLPMKSTAYRVANKRNTQIILHYSAGSQLATAQEAINAVNNRTPGGFSYHYLVLANGSVEQMIPDKDIAYHTKMRGGNRNSIGISFENLGWCYSPDRSYYGSIPSNQTRAVQLVDLNGNPITYRGKSYAQEITDAQRTALVSLIRKIKGNNPGITWPGLNSSTFQSMFPPIANFSPSIPGLYSHCAADNGKLDILPTPKMLDALKSIGPL